MSDILPTVKIKTKNGPVDINLSDFKEGVHELADSSDIPPLAPLDPAQQKTLLGASNQPEIFTLRNGETLKIETVVEEAFKRSGLDLAQWNKMAQGKRDKAIAEVVAEMVPPNPDTFTIGQSKKRGHADKFVILDGAGHPFGEEFDTEEAAQAHLTTLKESAA